jgi:hypothetical protein
MRIGRCTIGLILALLVLRPAPARAYAWMISHGYTACASCHSDPSGSGVLTPYGRAQGELLLRTHYGARPEEASPVGNFLWNAVQTPDWLLAGGQFRAMPIVTQIGSGATNTDLILMQADLLGEARAGSFRFSATAGVVTSNGSAAAVAGNLIARAYWVGYGAEDSTWLVRAGRIDVPYGLRIIDHTLYVRAVTRTDINDTQQHGVAFAYSGERLRGEVMAILGNYQISPDDYRQRGYSGFLEYAITNRFAAGISSLITHAVLDVNLRAPLTHQAHGAFARVSPLAGFVVMAEADLVLERPTGVPGATGLVTMLQADVEPIQGLHLIATGESNGTSQGGTSYGGWLAAQWFFAPHFDVRFDVMKRSDWFGNQQIGSVAYMVQGHTYF